ncbi:MAG: hypothetical protein AAF467_00090 [Actinomycetota bacterium]
MHTTDPAPADFGGLAPDLERLVGRRRALQWVGAAGLAGLAIGCSTDHAGSTSPDASAPSSTASNGTATDAGTSSTTAADAGATDAGDTTGTAPPEPAASPGAEIPDETAGPFPADGTNGPNVLDIDGVVRPDIRSSIGELSGTAEGIETTLNLTVVDAATGDPRPGAAIYLWQNAANGLYSVYQIEDQNFLRGLQAADDAGRITFTTVFPGCYPGRWPHCHFEVYETIDGASNGDNAIKTSQLALPRADAEQVYADTRYGDSAAELAELTLASDGVFADGWEEQLATVTGDNANGYAVSLLVRV